MSPTNSKLRFVEGMISETTAQIHALQLELERAEFKLQVLQKEKAAILETSKDHRSVISAVRNLPEDVLRQILIACVEDEKPPILSYRPIPLPYRLAQISSGFRRIALSTPIMWASMYVQFDAFLYENLDEQAYSILAHMVRVWFERAGGLPLTVFIEGPGSSPYENEDYGESDPSNILFDTLFSYSARWQDIQFISPRNDFSLPVFRIVALKAADVPMLQSVSLFLECSIPTTLLSTTVLLKTPTLRHVSIKTDNLRQIPVNWANLTAISLKGSPYSITQGYSKNEIAKIFGEIKCLAYCDIEVGPPRSGEEIILEKTSLPFLTTLHITERASRLRPTASPQSPSLLDLLSTPILAELHIHEGFFECSLLDFLKQTPNMSQLTLPYLKDDKSFAITLTFLRHCPLLTVLSLCPCSDDTNRGPSNWDANMFLQSFVQADESSGVTCPFLQFFKFEGAIDFSLETLCLFLKGKQRLSVKQNIGPSKVAPWRNVTISIKGIKDPETKKKAMFFIFQKQSEGVNVYISL